MTKPPAQITSPLCTGCKGGCCKSCAPMLGYHRMPVLNQAGITGHPSWHGPDKAMANKMTRFFSKLAGHKVVFDRKAGFLTDKGCALPVNIRSATCRSWLCTPALIHKGLGLNGEFTSPDQFKQTEYYSDNIDNISEAERSARDETYDVFRKAQKELTRLVRSRGLKV